MVSEGQHSKQHDALVTKDLAVATWTWIFCILAELPCAVMVYCRFGDGKGEQRGGEPPGAQEVKHRLDVWVQKPGNRRAAPHEDEASHLVANFGTRDERGDLGIVLRDAQQQRHEGGQEER